MEIIVAILAVLGTIFGLGAGVKKLSKDKRELKAELENRESGDRMADKIRRDTADPDVRERLRESYERKDE